MSEIKELTVNEITYGRVVNGHLELYPIAYKLPVEDFINLLHEAAVSPSEIPAIADRFLSMRSEGATIPHRTLFDRLWGKGGYTIPTGIPNLDAFLDGGISRGMTVIAAPPRRGKSTLTLQLARSLSSQGAGVIYYCNDMPEEELIAKMLSGVSHEISKGKGGWTAKEILRGQEDLQRNDEFKKAGATYFSQTRSLILETGMEARSLSSLEKSIDFYIALFEASSLHDRPPVIIIDYLQNVLLEGKGNEREQVDAVLRMLKSRIDSTGLTVIAISSVSRDKYPGALRMNSLKESGLIEYTSNVVLALQHRAVHRNDYDEAKESRQPEQHMELYTLKERMGESEMSLPITFVPKYSLFRFNGKVHNSSRTPMKKLKLEGI